jgi:DNA-binding GntR family transcriptional regulator
MELKTPETIPYFLHEQIRQLIIDGSLRPGQPLREQELEKRFGTSRSPIREALRLLELNGLVTHAQRRGFRVALYTEREICQLYLLRAEFEAYAITQLAEGDDLAGLQEELRACEARMHSYDPSEALLDYLTQVREFFGIIVRFNHNNPLSEALSKMNERCEPLRHNLMRRGVTNVEAASGYVRTIIDAIAAGNFEGAANARREYARWHLPLIMQAYAEAVYPAADSGPQ